MKNKSIIIGLVLLVAPTLKSCGPRFWAEAFMYDSYTKQEKIEITQTKKEVEIFCGHYRKEMDCTTILDKSDKKPN